MLPDLKATIIGGLQLQWGIRMVSQGIVRETYIPRVRIGGGLLQGAQGIELG